MAFAYLQSKMREDLLFICQLSFLFCKNSLIFLLLLVFLQFITNLDILRQSYRKYFVCVHDKVQKHCLFCTLSSVCFYILIHGRNKKDAFRLWNGFAFIDFVFSRLLIAIATEHQNDNFPQICCC